jgi:hypothetical protein
MGRTFDMAYESGKAEPWMPRALSVARPLPFFFCVAFPFRLAPALTGFLPRPLPLPFLFEVLFIMLF